MINLIPPVLNTGSESYLFPDPGNFWRFSGIIFAARALVLYAPCNEIPKAGTDARIARLLRTTGQRRSVQPNQVLFPINDAGVQENHCSRFLYSFAISVRTYI